MLSCNSASPKRIGMDIRHTLSASEMRYYKE